MSKSARRIGGIVAAMRVTLLVLLAGQAMASMDSSILTVSMPSLQSDLHASGAELQLLAAAYTLAFGALVVTGARLGDVLGQRRAFLLGVAGFTAASVAGGLAPSPAALVVARAVQGAAGALLTPQVLSIIQLSYEGETRARAIGAYSMILAVGVAAGQVLGGLIVGAHLIAAAWRPALLINAPIGAALLLGGRGALPETEPRAARTLDVAGVVVFAATAVAFVTPLTFGRQAGWPAWTWPCVAAAVLGAALFGALERRVAATGRSPIFDLTLFALPGVVFGATAVLLVMGCYAGFLFSVTLHLQNGLRFSPLHAGLTFAAYASGFAAASLTWTRARAALRPWLPVLGPGAMAVALVGVGLLGRNGGWPAAATLPLLALGGAGHAWGFSPLASRLSGTVRNEQVADLSGLLYTASLLGGVVGIAAFGGIYLGTAGHGSGHALLVTTLALAGALAVTAACALRAARPTLEA
jgi:MFS family permease